MECLCYYLCCGYCCRQKYEKKDYKRHKDMTQLEAIETKTKSEVLSTENPLSVKTEKITDIYKFPNPEYKTKNDLIRGLGYQMAEYIDSGAFATVWKAHHIASGLEVAVKVVDIPPELDRKSAQRRRGLLEDMKNELCILQKVKHRHVVRLITHFVVVSAPQMTLYIIMQFAKGGNLSKMCELSGPFNERSCKLWFAQMLSALTYVHSKGVAHRDLKVSNILLDEQNDVLISDFGLSRLVWRETTQDNLVSRTFCGTPPYMSPELLMQRKHTVGYDAMAVDVWALGVIVYKLFTKDYPFPHSKRKALKYMKARLWRFPKNTGSAPTKEFRSILQTIFEPRPKKRPKMSALTTHVWVRELYQSIEQNSIKLK